MAGFLRTPSGVGESARLCFAALAALGLSPRYVDLSQRFGHRPLLDVFDEGGDADWSSAGPLIIHANPPELAAVLCRLGRRAVANRYIVGYWAWELEQVPRSWKSAFRHVHEIWVPSQFTADAVRPHANRPVRVVPHPLAVQSPVPDRSAFGLAEDDLVVLSVCDLRSSAERKNLFGNIEAFRMAFGESEQNVLIMKLGGFAEYPQLSASIMKTISGLNNVVALPEPLSPARMNTLIATADIVLSLHRSEGFGLLPAQAMMLGIPAIATDWSGNVDYMADGVGIGIPPLRLVPVIDPQGIYPHRSQRWADPDLSQAADALRQLADNSDLRARLGTASATAIRRYCAPERFWQSAGHQFRRLSGDASAYAPTNSPT